MEIFLIIFYKIDDFVDVLILYLFIYFLNNFSTLHICFENLSFIYFFMMNNYFQVLIWHHFY